jgi:hypothetical protein
MSTLMQNLNIAWPLGEPQWIDFKEDFVIFADIEFLKSWEGVDSPLWDTDIRDAYNKPWHRLDANKAGWLLGEMPGLLAPSIGCGRDGKSQLVIWELISAEDKFVLPNEVVLLSTDFPAPIFSTILDTCGLEFRIFPSQECGEVVMARHDLPIFYFNNSNSNLDVFPIRLTAGGGTAEFLLHIFSNGFERYDWNTRE